MSSMTGKVDFGYNLPLPSEWILYSSYKIVINFSFIQI